MAAAPLASRRQHVLAGALLAGALALPWVSNDFFTFQIAAQALVLGLIALSLTMLAGYGGMVSLAQMSIAGLAGYLLAILGMSNGTQSLGWPWWVATPAAVALATLAGGFVGWLSARTQGVYTIMITLAVGIAFFYLVQQNYALFNGFQGLSGVRPPALFGLDWRAPTPFYYLALGCALAGHGLMQVLVRAPFGLALQAIRDNPRRADALGYDVVWHRVASHAFAGMLAAVGGILLTWYNSFISPGVVGVTAMINILVIAVIGGMKSPGGAFIGAFAFVLLQNFAIDLVGSDRFRMLIGSVFLLIVLFSPDGLLGLWEKARARTRRRRPAPLDTRAADGLPPRSIDALPSHLGRRKANP